MKTQEHDSLHDNIGQAIADYLTSLAEDNVVTLDPFDARNIDAIVEEVMPVVDAEMDKLRTALQRITEVHGQWNNGMHVANLARRALNGQCLECGSKGFAPSKLGPGCEFCDGTEGGAK